jgi:hypothetical protein
MSLNISRTTEPLGFDTGIGHTGYAEILDGPVAAEQTGVLLPGATTVTESLDALFPVEQDVSADVMRALVAGNPSSLRTQNGFGSAATDALRPTLSLSAAVSSCSSLVSVLWKRK